MWNRAKRTPTVSNSPVKFCVRIFHSWAVCVLKQKQSIQSQINQTRKKRTKAKDGFDFCVGCSSLQSTRVSAKRNWKNQVQLKKKKKNQFSKSLWSWMKQ